MKTVIPASAAFLLGFIYETETSCTAPQCYQTIYGHNEDKLSKPLTSMTINEILSAQSSWSKRFGSSATGAPQFMKFTLQGLKTELKLSGSETFVSDLQDRLAYHLLKRRGYEAFMAGKITITEFGRRLAMEWASFPVLAATDGSERTVKRGQSYYAGDGLNKALVKPETVETVLAKVYEMRGSGTSYVPDAPAPKPVAPTKPVAGVSAVILTTAVILVGTFWSWLTEAACALDIFNLFCGG